MLGLLLAPVLAAQTQPPQNLHIPPPLNRFQMSSGNLGLPMILLDQYNNGQGLAQQMARAQNLQGRVLWIDGTANIERVNTTEKIDALMKRIKSAGFNTIVFDVKPISGQVLYKSALAPKMTEWRGRNLPLEFDPLEAMVPLAKREGLVMLISLNAFSEGHTMFSTGPGYARPDLQTVVYDPIPILVAGSSSYRLNDAANAMPKTEDVLGVFSSEASLQNPQEGLFAVTVRPDGTVVDGFVRGGEGKGTPTVPQGGTIVAGFGKAGEFLRTHAIPGSVVRFDTRAEFKPISERVQQIPLMMNLHHPEVQQYALSIVEELVRKYDIDGVLYDDRLRYSGLNGDFSPLARERFEAYVGQKLNWPDDVFKFTTNAQLTRGVRPGRFYDAWMLWRALQMRNWVARARETVKRERKNALFGIYAGSWYGEYPSYGANYASPDLQAGFWFHTRSFAKTGFAPLLDMLITGTYYPVTTIHEAMSGGTPPGRTVEAGGQLSNFVARDECWTYAGIMLQDYRGNKAAVERALVAATASTQGVMVFDLSHDIEPMWEVFERAFRVPAVAPHQRMPVLEEIRRKRQKLDAMGAFPRPVPIIGGTPGAGH
jgi:hypothetical protein